ncbi:MAG: hypothetical protein QGH95_03875 [Candidatus Nitrosopelagicus sp.]|nr:hypothetical protein [Candidatus Nitrosopelagicus sp.]
MTDSHFGHLSPFVTPPHFLHFDEYPMTSFFPVFVYLKIKMNVIKIPIAAAAIHSNMSYLESNSIKN